MQRKIRDSDGNAEYPIAHLRRAVGDFYVIDNP